MPTNKSHNIDRDKLRAAIRRLTNKNIFYLLDEALDMLPDKKLAKLAGRYLDPQTLQPESKEKTSLLADIKAFEKASLRGDYYESFRVNSKNYTEMSKGTRAWIAECQRLLSRCVMTAKKTNPSATREALEIIFGLLRHIDECLDDVVFFADEAGSWQVGVDWKTVLPVWFTCLSATTDAVEYAHRVIEVVDEFVKYDRDKFLAVAGRKASSVQRKTLDDLSGVKDIKKSS